MKPIETVYNGYRFRSRLEARWAVFFDALHIAYTYEPEGYDLDGVWYLPDFWLPEHNCWVEIKAQRPTEDEKEKARLLAWHTGKDAYIFHGDVWLPGLATGFSAISVHVSVKRYDGETIKEIREEVVLPYNLASLLRRLDQDLECSLVYNPEDNRFLLSSWWEEMLRPYANLLHHLLNKMKEDIQHLEWRIQELPALMEQIESRKQDFVAHIPPTIPLDTLVYFNAHSSYDDPVAPYWWIVCRKCKRPHICNEFYSHNKCSCFDECEDDEEPLLAGFTAARQARFEHRRKPS